MTSTGENRVFETSDKWAIMCLRLGDFIPSKIYTIDGKREDKPILVYVFDGEPAYKLFDEWIRGVQFPVMSLQDVVEMDAEFKRNMFEYSRRHRAGK